MKHPRIPATPSRRTLYLLPAIDDDLPPQIKNALALRNATTTTGTCPNCGATPELHTDPRAGIYHLVFQHEPHCHALTDDAA